MLTKYRNIFYLFIVFLTTISCNKYNSSKNTVSTFPDIFKPVVSITTPIANYSYSGKSLVSIVGTVTDKYLQSLSVKVMRTDDSIYIFDKSFSVTSLAGYTINTGFNPAITTTTSIPCVLIVNASDNANNAIADTTWFSIH